MQMNGTQTTGRQGTEGTTRGQRGRMKVALRRLIPAAVAFALIVAGIASSGMNPCHGSALAEEPADGSAQPESAIDAVQRYFAARVLGMDEEVQGLIAQEEDDDFFSVDALAALPVPDNIATVEATAYLVQVGRELYEVTYTSGTQPVRAWLGVALSGSWKLLGAADSYGAGLTTDGVDFQAPLFSLNEEATITVSPRGSSEVWRVLVPVAGRLNVAWQYGSKASDTADYVVSLHHGSMTDDELFSGNVKPNPNIQQSKDLFVAAGVYYLSVGALNSRTDACTLILHYAPEDNVELENNNTSVTATPVTVGNPCKGIISDRDDVDFFSFAVDQTSAVNLIFALPGSGNNMSTHRLTLFSADGASHSDFEVPGNTEIIESGELFLSAGTYYVRISRGQRFSNDPYELTVMLGQYQNAESEPNDTPDTATAIMLNTDILASTGKEMDTDCYSFTLDSPSLVQPKLTFAPLETSSRAFELTITDASHRDQYYTTIGGKQSSLTLVPAALPAGDYILKVRSVRSVRQDYTLHLICQPVQTVEEEPNNSASSATRLSFGQPYSGVLGSDTDKDYYRFETDEDAVVQLKFSFEPGNSSQIAYSIVIRNNGETVWHRGATGDSGGFKVTLQGLSGEYYLEISPSHWLSNVYTLSVDTVEPAVE